MAAARRLLAFALRIAVPAHGRLTIALRAGTLRKLPHIDSQLAAELGLLVHSGTAAEEEPPVKVTRSAQKVGTVCSLTLRVYDSNRPVPVDFEQRDNSDNALKSGCCAPAQPDN